MEEVPVFGYFKEFWYINAFINTNYFIGETKAEEIEALLLERLKNLNENELSLAYNFLEKYSNAEEKKRSLVHMAKHIDIECDWEPIFHNFPYMDEENPYTHNFRPIVYNTLGCFKFEVEYYKDNPSKKEIVTPELIQLLLFLSLEILKDFSKDENNTFLLLDTSRLIYPIILCETKTSKNIVWTKDKVNYHKKLIGKWVTLASGLERAFTDEYYNKIVADNLSNEVSRIEIIQTNSGLIVSEQNYFLKEFYRMEKTILSPTAEFRVLQFASMTINNSLDFLYRKRYSDVFMSLGRIEEKNKNLKFLRGMIQSKMNLIYNTIDLSVDYHYSVVLSYLNNLFHLENIQKRMFKKFEVMESSMPELYQKRTKTELRYLSFLLGAGMIAEIINSFSISMQIQEIQTPSVILHLIFALAMSTAIGSILIISLVKLLKERIVEKAPSVTAVIQDNNRNIILIKRKYPPYKGMYALPGGLLLFDEDAKYGLVRLVMIETNLHVRILKKIGTYDKKGRDPRGRVVDTAYSCLVKDLSQLRGGDIAQAAEAIPIENLRHMELAFDHRRILNDAGVFK